MGKHKRKHTYDSDDPDDLYRQVKRIKKSLKRKRKLSKERNITPDYQVLEDPATIHETDHEEIVDANIEKPIEVETLSKQTVAGESHIEQSSDLELISEQMPVAEPVEFLNDILGEDPTKTNKYGPEIHKDIASRWEHISREGLQKDIKSELLKSTLIPSNCKFLEAPGLNAEIKAAISEQVYKRDKILISQQNLLGQATAHIAQALNDMLKNQNKDLEVIKKVSNAGRMLCELFFTKSSARRTLIQFALNKETKDIVTETKITDNLFGENLCEALKAGKAISKTGSEIRSKPLPAKQKQPLNYRGPPRKQQQQRPLPPSAGRSSYNKQNKSLPRHQGPHKTQSYKPKK